MRWIRSKINSYIKRVVDESLPKPKVGPVYPAVDILLNLHGYAQTVQSKLPVGADGSPLPWYTYPAIEYFDQLDAKGLRIFEYGSGNSSLYWAHKGAEVWSVEHDRAWFEIMSHKAARLAGLLLRETAEDYAAAIDVVSGLLDIIIIDGAWRNECASACLGRLAAGGLVILDNSDWYTDVGKFLRLNGLFQIDFSGFGPINDYCWTTSIFLKLHSPLIDRLRFPRPVGGIEVFKADKW